MDAYLLQRHTSQPLTKDEISTWTRRASVEAYDSGIVRRLFVDICRLYQELLRSLFNSKDANVPKPLYRKLESGYTCLQTWGNEYRVEDGTLDTLLEVSRRLQLSTIKVMMNICGTLTDELMPLMPKNGNQQTIKSMARVLATTVDDALVVFQNTAKDFDTMSDDSDQGSNSWTTNPALEDVVGNLKTDVECLMDMAPRFEDPVPSNGDRPPTSAGVKALSWDPVKPFAERIKAKFPSCDPIIVKAGSKSVYDTFHRLYEARQAVITGVAAQRPKENRSSGSDSGFFSGSSLTAGNLQPEQQQDGGQSQSGASLAGSLMEQTIMSYTADNGTTRARIPPQPKDIGVGEVFPCTACGKQVAKARSKRAWKRHLLSDLRPWICCQIACPCDRKPFNSRDTWLRHLQAQHNVHPDWDDKSCPFCRESVPLGGEVMMRHVEVHLQEISLVALPPPAEDDEEGEVGSNDSDCGSGPDQDEGGSTPPNPEENAILNFNIQDHQVYKSAKPNEDGLWHCAWEGEDYCTHEATMLKSDFDDWVTEHLTSFLCKQPACATAGQPFSTPECLRLHQQDVHKIFKGGERPHLCTSKGCGRSIPGNGFANPWVLQDHIKTVHKNVEGLPPVPEVDDR